MKIIEAMKEVKLNDEKIVELRTRIKQTCSHTSLEKPLYGDETRDKIKKWVQMCKDVSQRNIELLCAIQKTNMETPVTIQLGEKSVTKTIAAWIWRRRKYATQDLETMRSLSDKGLQEGFINPSGAETPVKVEIVRYYDPAARDDEADMYREEPHRIDAALEIVNATTDLII